MSQVFDLGEVAPRPRRAAAPRTPTVERHRTGPAGIPPGVCGTLSLFLPGAGQTARGEFARGLFFLTAIAFLGAFARALLVTLDRLVPTLELLGLSVAAVFGTLAVAYGLAAASHVAGALNALGPADATCGRCHPVLSGAASVLVPGWGQLLNGDRVRAGLCLGCLWLVGAVWILSSGATEALLNTYASVVSPLEQLLREPRILWSARWTAPAVLWSLAVYDAASSAGRRTP